MTGQEIRNRARLRRVTPSPRSRQVTLATLMAAGGMLAAHFGRAHYLLVGPRPLLLIAGASLLAAGVLLRALAFLTLPSTWHIERLVTSGIYAYTRNPIYLAFALIVVGLGLISQTWLAFPWLALCLGLFWLVAKREESDLRRAFGEEYERYRRRVPLFLPRLRRAGSPPPASP